LIAGLTWHYADRAFGAGTVVNPFPNPGTVPTEFVFGSRFDRYFGAQWLDPTSPTRTVRDLVIQGLVGHRAQSTLQDRALHGGAGDRPAHQSEHAAGQPWRRSRRTGRRSSGTMTARRSWRRCGSF
jgi:hypothetical protein